MNVNTVEMVGLYAIAFGLGLVVVATGLQAPWLGVLFAGVFVDSKAHKGTKNATE